MKIFVNLFIPGAAKSGTSSLHAYLNQHPDINMSSEKEPHFFCEKRSNESWINYSKMFDEKSKYNGESSTGYMVFDGVIERIKEYNKDAKFIFILRNPVDRVISHYNWLYGVVAEDKSFMDAFNFDLEYEPVYKKNIHGPGYKNYYQWGLYFKYLTRYYKAFPKKNILLITTESLKENPQETLNQCTNFLKLPKYQFDCSKKVNKSKSVQNRVLYKWIVAFEFKKTRFGPLFEYVPLPLRSKIYKIRRWIAGTFKKDISPNNLTNNQQIRDKLTNLYSEDVKKLKSLVKLEFEEWKEFK